MKKFKHLLLCSTIIVFFGCDKSQNTANTSVISERMIDSANILTDLQEDSLFTLLHTFEKVMGTQIAIVTIDSLEKKTIEEYAIEKFETLNLGRKKFKDGLMIIVALRNAKVRIEVGYGLERIIRDEVAARIIREILVPNFQKARYYNGLREAVIEIQKRISENKKLIGVLP